MTTGRTPTSPFSPPQNEGRKALSGLQGGEFLQISEGRIVEKATDAESLQEGTLCQARPGQMSHDNDPLISWVDPRALGSVP